MKVLNYDSWPFGNSTPDDYKLWDWTKLTDIITPYLPAQRPEVAALAEQHKVKLITDWDTLLLTDAFMLQHNTTSWAAWIDREVKLRIVSHTTAGMLEQNVAQIPAQLIRADRWKEAWVGSTSMWST